MELVVFVIVCQLYLQLFKRCCCYTSFSTDFSKPLTSNFFSSKIFAKEQFFAAVNIFFRWRKEDGEDVPQLFCTELICMGFSTLGLEVKKKIFTTYIRSKKKKFFFFIPERVNFQIYQKHFFGANKKHSKLSCDHPSASFCNRFVNTKLIVLRKKKHV